MNGSFGGPQQLGVMNVEAGHGRAYAQVKGKACMGAAPHME